MFMERSVILWDQLQIIMKICGSEREDRGSSEHHINRKLMVNAYQESEIWENTGGCFDGLEYTECIQHFGWEMF
jgi:hypothetical protein